MTGTVVYISVFSALFFLVFETCLAWLCAALARIQDASIIRSARLLIFEVLIPVPVAGIIGFSVSCVIKGPAGLHAGVLCTAGFLTYLFLTIARSVYETSYARAVLFSFFFLLANLFVSFVLSQSPTVDNLRHAVISWPK